MAYGDEWRRESEADQLRWGEVRRMWEQEDQSRDPDDRLDELGWDIFGLAFLRGMTVGEAVRLAMDGNYRQRMLVRDDMRRRLFAANRRRYTELHPELAHLPSTEATAPEQLGFWSKRLVNPEFVYFIQQGEHGPVKIGRSNRPERRIGNLQTGNPDELSLRHVIPGNKDTERHLHARFKPWLIRGEWFIDPEYLGVIITFAAGLADEMLHRFDGTGHPPTIRGAEVRTHAEIERIRRDIERMRLDSHEPPDIARVLGLDPEDVQEHLAVMRKSGMYNVGRSNLVSPIHRPFLRTIRRENK
jgi:hypothetical protein